MSTKNFDVINFQKSGYRFTVHPENFANGSLGYVAEHPDLPGCMAQGLTVEEAIQNLDEARRQYLQVLLEDGEAVPAPIQAGCQTASYGSAILETKLVTASGDTAQFLVETNLELTAR